MDEVLDEWNMLVVRERSAAYEIETIKQGQSSDIIFPYCPASLIEREDICEWCYQVIDQCDIDRSIVSIAMSYFDRYLSCLESINETLVQLVGMTSLFLAVKIHSTRKISVSCISSLSQGYFQDSQILKMERCIILSLRWRLNPPTSVMYLVVAGPLIDDYVDREDISTKLKELSRYLLELSVCDGYFANKKPSSIAQAAIFVAMDVLSIPNTNTLLHQLDKSTLLAKHCIQRLHQLYGATLLQLKEEANDSLGNDAPRK